MRNKPTLCKNEALQFCFIKVAIKCPFNIHTDICGIQKKMQGKKINDTVGNLVQF